MHDHIKKLIMYYIIDIIIDVLYHRRYNYPIIIEFVCSINCLEELMANLTSMSYADEVKHSIKDNWTSGDPKDYGATILPITDSGTAHVSVLAPDGSAVSVTSTINQV